MDRMIDYESIDEGSIPSAPTNIGVWCNGNMAVSKTVDQGSKPCAPAKK